jgi:hypothetical protein
METRNYLLSEIDSYDSFAVISNVLPIGEDSNIELINKVILAVKEDLCHEGNITLVKDSISEINGTIYITFYLLDEDQDEDQDKLIIDYELNLVAIY